MRTSAFVTAAAAVAAAAAARTRLRRHREDITGEVALITGASRGLGLAMAHELARHSCRLVISARDSDELGRTAGELRAAGAEVTTVPGDLDQASTPQSLIDTAMQRYGRLDILVNNAGIIQVAPVENTKVSDYETALRTMAMASVRTTYAALPAMRAQGHGRIVNITSIGGKISVPHLLPYSVAKFAAVGFSEGLRAELGAHPVSVTTVVPGLMRTGSHLNAKFRGQAEEEFTWFSLGASLPVLSMDAEVAARQIIAAMRERRAEVILTPLGQVAARGAGLFPGLTSALLHLTKQLLPAPDGQPDQATAGGDLQPAVNQQLFDRLTSLARSAAHRFNEVPPPRQSEP